MSKSPDAFRTISEVADWLDTPAHVLRFWESKFSQVKPVKRAGGRRYYRPDDMALLGGIKALLHEQGMTIKGAQKLLREKGVKYVASLGPSGLGAKDADLIEAEATEPAAPPVDNVITMSSRRVAEAPSEEPAAASHDEDVSEPAEDADIVDVPASSNAVAAADTNAATAETEAPEPFAEDAAAATRDETRPGDPEEPEDDVWQAVSEDAAPDDTDGAPAVGDQPVPTAATLVAAPPDPARDAETPELPLGEPDATAGDAEPVAPEASPVPDPDDGGADTAPEDDDAVWDDLSTYEPGVSVDLDDSHPLTRLSTMHPGSLRRKSAQIAPLLARLDQIAQAMARR